MIFWVICGLILTGLVLRVILIWHLTEEPLVIQYANLLYKYRDPAAPAVIAFVKSNQDDAVLMSRVDILNKVHAMKQR